MFYPPQTSLMPIHIALARFWASEGFKVFSSNYPNWYMGTTPYRYLTGPVLPFLLSSFAKIFPSSSLFNIFYLLIVVFFIIGAGGVYLLLQELGGGKKLAILSAFFFLFGPLVLWLFPYSDGLSLISFSILPYIFWIDARVLKDSKHSDEVLLILLILFVILTNTLIINTLFLGMLAVLFAITGWKKLEKKVKKLLIFLFISLVLASNWYSLGYWYQVLIAPSFAGKSLFKVIAELGQLLPMVLAIVLAFVSGKFIKLKSKLSRFVFAWLFIFGFLTLMRFLSDPDFWQDWSAYSTELQFGLAIALALWLKRKLPAEKSKKIIVLTPIVLVYLFFFLFSFNTNVLSTIREDISGSVESRITRELEQRTEPGDSVFLSGSTVFWLNSFGDIKQVRGGNDRVSVHPTWREAAWEIREGEDPEKTLKVIKELNIRWLVVHTKGSSEHYHDFKYPAKFDHIRQLIKVYDQDGDRIYKLK